jgi:hypothetical protein
VTRIGARHGAAASCQQGDTPWARARQNGGSSTVSSRSGMKDSSSAASS